MSNTPHVEFADKEVTDRLRELATAFCREQAAPMMDLLRFSLPSGAHLSLVVRFPDYSGGTIVTGDDPPNVIEDCIRTLIEQEQARHG